MCNYQTWKEFWDLDKLSEKEEEKSVKK